MKIWRIEFIFKKIRLIEFGQFYLDSFKKIVYSLNINGPTQLRVKWNKRMSLTWRKIFQQQLWFYLYQTYFWLKYLLLCFNGALRHAIVAIHQSRLFSFSFILKANMAGSPKLFERLEKVLQSMAVPSSGQIPKSTIIWKRTFFFLSMILYIITSLVYFVFEAKLVSEYCDSFYLFTTESTTTFYLFTYIQKMPRIAAFIDKLNAFFEESK